MLDMMRYKHNPYQPPTFCNLIYGTPSSSYLTVVAVLCNPLSDNRKHLDRSGVVTYGVAAAPKLSSRKFVFFQASARERERETRGVARWGMEKEQGNRGNWVVGRDMCEGQLEMHARHAGTLVFVVSKPPRVRLAVGQCLPGYILDDWIAS